MTEPRDGAPDEELDPEPVDDRARTDDAEAPESDAAEPLEGDDDLDGTPQPLDDEDDLIDDSEADVDAEVDDYDAAMAEVSGTGPVPPPVSRRDREPRTRGQAKPTRAPSPSEIAVHVREDWSRAYVLIVVIVFVGILLYGLILGHGGLLTPLPTPSPEPSETPSTSPSAAASESPGASVSITPSSAAPSSATPSSGAGASVSPSP